PRHRSILRGGSAEVPRRCAEGIFTRSGQIISPRRSADALRVLRVKSLRPRHWHGPRRGEARCAGRKNMTEQEQTLLEAAQALLPRLTERAAATNAGRDVVAETIADFHRTGILRIIQPRRFGGLQLRFSLFSRIVELLAEGCASSGWVYAVL